MNQMEKFINTFAHFVWLGAGRWGIQKMNAHIGSKFKKRTGSCPSLGCSSCREAGSGGRETLVTTATCVTGVLCSTSIVSGDLGNIRDEKVYKTRFCYNSRVVPSKVDALLARRRQKCEVLSSNTVRSHVFNKTAQQVCNNSLGAGRLVPKVAHNDFSHPNVHSNRGVGHVTIGNDIDVVKNSIQSPATNKLLSFNLVVLGLNLSQLGMNLVSMKLSRIVPGMYPGTWW